MMLGAAVLVGWILHIDSLKSILPGLISMKANTAICFILTGTALWLSVDETSRTSRQRYTVVCAGMATLIAFLVGVEYVTGFNLHIDQVVFTDSGPTPGRMASSTTIAFIALGSALLLPNARPRWRPANLLATGGLLIGLWVVTGSAYDVASLYGLAAFNSVALHTGVGLVILSLGVLAENPDNALLRLWVSDSAGGLLLRRVLPATFLVPTVSGWLQRRGEALNLFDASFSAVLFTVTDMAIYTTLFAWSARSMHQLDKQRRQTADRLVLSEQRFRKLFESDIIGVMATDLQGHILEANTAFLRMTGYSEQDLAHDTMSWSDMTPVEYRAAHQGVLQELAEKGVAHAFEKEYIRKDGSRVPVLLGIVRVSNNEAVSFVLDMTERKRLELQLTQAQRMEIVGLLAGGVAHDFNNLLTPIIGYSDMLLDSAVQDAATLADLQEIRKAGERAASLTKQLLAFSRKQVLQPKVIDLNPLVSNMARLLERILGEDIHIELHLRPDIGNILVDPGQMEQVIMNLAVNARDAMTQGGHFTLETSAVDLDAAYAAAHPEVRPGPHVLLAASDTGIGMDKQTMAHIFDPFFTTKEAGKGTGIGLATVLSIVKQSSGHIWVYSEPGQGSTFKLYFPGIAEQAPVLGPMPSSADHHGHETILVIEDDGALRALTHRVLAGRGYTLLMAESAETALALAANHSGPIQLLLTDVVMPDLSGPVVAGHISKMRPGIKVLYMSGYTADAIAHHGVLHKGLHLLDKPFTPDSLAIKVREVLDVPGLT
jgi:PAS domain S-box-containing protein